jgi:hypothetical protein
MPSTYSPLKIELPATGEQSGTWGNTTNTNLGTALEEAITGSADVTFASANVTLTLTDTNASQTARNLRLNLIGVTGGVTRALVVPAIEKLYLISNNCADSVIVGNATGSAVTVPAGNNVFVYNDGTDVLNAITYITSLNAVSIAAGSVITTQVDIASQGDLRLQDTTGGQYVALQAPGTVASSYTLTLPVDDGTNGQALITDGNGVLSWSSAASGDVYGPLTATDNAIARFDGTTGKIIQNSVVTIADTTGNMAGVGTLSSGAITSSSLTSTRVLYAGTAGLIQDSANLTFNGTVLTATDFTDSSLTAGRVTYAGVGGNLVDSANLTFNGTTLSATTVSATDLVDTSLTAGRVTYAGVGGSLVDSANLTFNGTTLVANDITDSSLTSGRVIFAGASGNLVDSSNLTWNGTTLGITGALTATANSTFSSTGALTISKGDTSQRPTPVSGMLRFNTQTTEFEGYNGTAWASVGGAALVNDTSTTSNLFPLFATATSGTAATLNTSNAKLLYKPSTGEFQSSELVASNGLFVNSRTVTANYTVPAGSNALSSGPVTVADGITVTVSDGSVWTVI